MAKESLVRLRYCECANFEAQLLRHKKLGRLTEYAGR